MTLALPLAIGLFAATATHAETLDAMVGRVAKAYGG